MKHDPAQLTLPEIYIPAITTRQPDGSIVVRAGKPVLLSGRDEIDTAEAARLTGLTQSRILGILDEGKLVEGRDWRRNGERGRFFIQRASILRYANRLPEREQ